MLGAPRAPGHRRGLVAWLRDQPVLMLLVLAGSSALLGYRISEFHALQERRAAADGAGAADGGKGLAAQAASAVAAALCDPCSPCDACPAVQAVQAPACPPPAVVGGPLGGGSDTSLADFYAHDPAFRPVDPTMAATPVCMVVRTYAGHRNMLMAMLASVLLWDHPGLTVYLLDTGKDVPFAELPKLAAMASAMAGRPDAVRLSRWRHGTARAQFPWYTEEDHGYLATDLTLEDLLTVRAEARKRGDATLPCEYLIVTNGDNLYGHDYLAATLGEIKTGAEMVNTHWVSHYDMNKAWILGWGEIQNGHCGPWRPGRDGEVAASPVFMKGCVDLGVVTFKTTLLEETGFRFAVDRLRTIPAGQQPPKEMFAGMNSLFYADGAFFERLYKRFKDAGATSKARMIRRALFVHQ